MDHEPKDGISPKAEDLVAELIIEALRQKRSGQLPTDVADKLRQMRLRIECRFGMEEDRKEKGEPDRLLTVQEIADYLRLKTKTIYKLTCEGRIPCFRMSKRMVRFDLNKVKKWIQRAECRGRLTRRIPVE